MGCHLAIHERAPSPRPPSLPAGKAGVLLVTSGPGATNLVTPLADAMMDGTPLVALTGQVATSAIGTDAFQEADVVRAPAI